MPRPINVSPGTTRLALPLSREATAATAKKIERDGGSNSNSHNDSGQRTGGEP